LCKIVYIPKEVLPKRRPISWITKQITYTQRTFTLLETGAHNSGYGHLLEIQASDNAWKLSKYKIARNKVATMLRKEKQTHRPLGLTLRQST